MDDVMKKYIEKFESDVSDVRKQIEEAKEALRSTGWTNKPLRDACERVVLLQERQLEMVIENHKRILELQGMGE